MAEPLRRVRFDGLDEIGVYLCGNGDLDLVWYDQQDPDWPVTITRDMRRAIVALLELPESALLEIRNLLESLG